MLLRSFHTLISHTTKTCNVLFRLTGKYRFADNKDKEPQLIDVSAQEIEQMRKIINADLSKPVQLDSDSNFFSNRQTQLSLQLMQVTAKEQLKPHLVKYSAAKPQLKQSDQADKNYVAQLLRCKFLILYKYVNLNGSIIDAEIQPIYSTLAENVHLLGEIQLTILYRLIAAQIKNNLQSPLNKKIPQFPIIQKPSHRNSELVSLLLMVYPMNQDKVYVNYHLLGKVKEENYREGHEQPQKEIIYDPVHLLIMLKHFFYYEDVQKLVHHCFSAKNVEESNYALDQLIRTEQQFQSRKIEALGFALAEGFAQICNLYLFKQNQILHSISLKHALDLLKSVLTLKNPEQYNQSQVSGTISNLLTAIHNKSQNPLELSDEEQLIENEHYKNVVEILSIILAKKQHLSTLPAVNALVDQIFEIKSKWRVSFQEYSYEDIFNFIVCYKGWKDLRMKHKMRSFDCECSLFKALLTNLREEMLQSAHIDQKQLFYVCYFAQSFDCLNVLNNERIVEELQRFSKSKDLNKNSLAIIERILVKFSSI